jgi:hypothetical protein
MIGQVGRRPRQRPPFRSYIPFAVFVFAVLIFLVAIIWLLLRLVEPGGNSAASVLATASPSPAQSSGGTLGPAATATRAVPSQSPVSSMLTVGTAAIATPTATASQGTHGTEAPTAQSIKPVVTATATNQASIVIARGVTKDHKPVEAATRFVSPAKRLYAIVTVKRVNAADLLRFVFQRNAKTLPRDDIQYQAGTGAPKQTFAAFADYQNGSKPLPTGHYRVLFYRNGHLEAVATFRVG